MLDINSLRMFGKVASLKSFTAAARALGLPKSNVSRAIARLEGQLGTRLFQRTTRDVVLTLTGQALLERSRDIIANLSEALAYVRSLAGQPRGLLKISAGMGFGVNVLAEQLPEFLLLYPDIEIALDLESRSADLVAEAVDVAVRLGPLPDSGLIAVKLGEMRRYLCAAPSHLERRGAPCSIDDIVGHDTIDMSRAEWQGEALDLFSGRRNDTNRNQAAHLGQRGADHSSSGFQRCRIGGLEWLYLRAPDRCGPACPSFPGLVTTTRRGQPGLP